MNDYSSIVYSLSTRTTACFMHYRQRIGALYSRANTFHTGHVSSFYTQHRKQRQKVQIFLRKRHKPYRGIGGTGSEVLGSRAGRFIPRKKLQVPSEQNTVWVPEIFLCVGEEKNLLSLSEFKLRVFRPVT